MTILRTIDYRTEQQFHKGSLFPVALVSLNFSSGNVFFWTGNQNIDWGGYTWLGTAGIGRIGQIEEAAELRAIGATLELSGVPSSVLEIALREEFQGRTAQIWIGALRENGELYDVPFQIFAGYMDTMELVEGSVANLRLSLESRLFDLERVRVRRYTQEDQRAEYTDDAGFDAVASLQEQEITWGAA